MSHNDDIGFDPHEVDHGTMYYKMHWGAWKGHVRGLTRGLIVGSAIGAIVGLGFAALAAASIVTLPVIAGVTVGAGMITAAMAAFGGILASGLLGRIGNAAGNVAAQLAEQELRDRYPELPEISPNSPQPGVGHHYEVPADRDVNKFYHGRVGLAGAALGAGFGGILSAAGLGSALSIHIPELLGYASMSAAEVALPGAGMIFSALPAAVGGLYGSSFGINRSHFKSIFNVTDRLLQGKIGGPSQAEQEKSRERYREMGDDGPPAIISSLQRQEEFYRLYEGYFKQAFEAGFAGNARGLIGGIVAGGIFGMLLGGVAAAAVMATGIVAAPAIASAAFLAVTATAMKMSGAHFFSEAAFEAAGHSHVHEIYHERQRNHRKGREIEFRQAEINVDRRRQADPELTPPAAQEDSWFKPRSAMVLGALGAMAGLGMAPLASGVAKMLSMGTAGAHLSMGSSAAVFGLTGASFGLGNKITKSLHGFADQIYHGAFNPGDNHPDIKIEGRIPLMSPRSELAEHFSKHLLKNMPEIEYNNDVTPQPAHAADNTARDTSPAVQQALEQGARSFTEKVHDVAVAPQEVQR